VRAMSPSVCGERRHSHYVDGRGNDREPLIRRPSARVRRHVQVLAAGRSKGRQAALRSPPTTSRHHGELTRFMATSHSRPQ
jgi:hypothetical protein